MSGKLVAAEAGSGKGREWKGMMQTSDGDKGMTVGGKRNLFDSGKSGPNIDFPFKETWRRENASAIALLANPISM